MSRALSCSFCRWLRSVILSTVPIMVTLFTASLHNRGQQRAEQHQEHTRAQGTQEQSSTNPSLLCLSHEVSRTLCSSIFRAGREQEKLGLTH